jgi:regulatory subunit for Cdc7p protein kinase
MSTNRSRAPLASIPNATNSPHRALAHSTKRPRAQANISQQENEPPQKRQMVEKDTASAQPSTPRRRIPPSTGEGRVFEKGTVNGHPTAFQRKLVAARDRTATLKVTKSVEGPTAQNLETIRQWQKHYRKVFPEYTFYFESIPEDLKGRFSRQIASLGAVCLIPTYISSSFSCQIYASPGLNNWHRPSAVHHQNISICL